MSARRPSATEGRAPHNLGGCCAMGLCGPERLEAARLQARRAERRADRRWLADYDAVRPL